MYSVAYDMDGVFNIPSKFQNDLPSNDCSSIDLFDCDNETEANKFHFLYGKEYHAENFKWSGEQVLNSCSTELRDKILEEVQDYKTVRVYEDNEGALKLASAPLPNFTPQDKYFAVKNHWFREKIDDYNIRILPILSENQKADIFTKGLARIDFRNKRQLLMG